MSEDTSPLANFAGVARLFPLPNLVFFPHVMQPLHIFEPRYRQMTADALAGDRLIALTLLQPGWEDQYEGRPAVHPVACLGRVVADQLLPGILAQRVSPAVQLVLKLADVALSLIQFRFLRVKARLNLTGGFLPVFGADDCALDIDDADFGGRSLRARRQSQSKNQSR